MSTALIHHTSDAAFASDVLQSGAPVLVDCWANWCGPCNAITPLLDEAAQTYGARLKIVKINVDENLVVPARLGVSEAPTLMFFKGGRMMASQAGALTRAQLTAFIDSHL